jgi:hypothetical protein
MGICVPKSQELLMKKKNESKKKGKRRALVGVDLE